MDDPKQDSRAFVQVHSALARRIKDGEYPAGAKLLSETELALSFHPGLGPVQRA